MLLSQGWTDEIDSNWDPTLTLFIGGMTLIRGQFEAFIGYWQAIASLLVYTMKTVLQLAYITGMWHVLAGKKFLEMHHTV